MFHALGGDIHKIHSFQAKLRDFSAILRVF